MWNYKIVWRRDFNVRKRKHRWNSWIGIFRNLLSDGAGNDILEYEILRYKGSKRLESTRPHFLNHFLQTCNIRITPHVFYYCRPPGQFPSTVSNSLLKRLLCDSLCSDPPLSDKRIAHVKGILVVAFNHSFETFGSKDTHELKRSFIFRKVNVQFRCSILRLNGSNNGVCTSR